MTITQDEAIQMAREVGAVVDNGTALLPQTPVYLLFAEELTAFANTVRRKALLEAAEYMGKYTVRAKDLANDLLRDMAEGE